MLLPGKSHGWRSLAGCSPWGCWGLNTTERLHFHFSLSCIGGGNGNPLQCSCLENPRDGGAWWAAVYGVAQSRTQLKWLSSNLAAVQLLQLLDSKRLGIDFSTYTVWFSNSSLSYYNHYTMQFTFAMKWFSVRSDSDFILSLSLTKILAFDNSISTLTYRRIFQCLWKQKGKQVFQRLL